MPISTISYLEKSKKDLKTKTLSEPNSPVKTLEHCTVNKLTILRLKDCKFITDFELQNILLRSRLTLTSLEIDNCPITDKSIQFILTTFPELTHLRLNQLEQITSLDDSRQTQVTFFNSTITAKKLNTLIITHCRNLSRINIIAPALTTYHINCFLINSNHLNLIKNLGIFYINSATSTPAQILKKLVKNPFKKISNKNKGAPLSVKNLPKNLNIVILGNDDLEKYQFITQLSNPSLHIPKSLPTPPETNKEQPQENVKIPAKPNEEQKNEEEKNEKEESAKTVEYVGKKTVAYATYLYTLHFWDASLEQQFTPLTQSYIRDAAVVIMHLSPSDKNPTAAFQHWINYLNEKNSKSENKIPVLLTRNSDSLNKIPEDKLGLHFAPKLTRVKYHEYNFNYESLNELFGEIVKLGKKTAHMYIKTATGNCLYQKTPEYFYDLGIGNFKKQNYFSAYLDFMKAIELDPLYYNSVNNFLEHDIASINKFNNEEHDESDTFEFLH